jgi:hypothetical protein
MVFVEESRSKITVGSFDGNEHNRATTFPMEDNIFYNKIKVFVPE